MAFVDINTLYVTANTKLHRKHIFIVAGMAVNSDTLNVETTVRTLQLITHSHINEKCFCSFISVNKNAYYFTHKEFTTAMPP